MGDKKKNKGGNDGATSKKKKGESDGNANGANNGEGLSEQDEITRIKKEITSLQNEILCEKQQKSEAESGMREFRKHYELLLHEFNKEKEKTFVLSANMTRQYKIMRDELMNKQTQLEEELQESILNAQRIKADGKKQVQKFNSIIQAKNEEIHECKEKMKQMSQEFGLMLQQTIDQMSQKIVISS